MLFFKKNRLSFCMIMSISIATFFHINSHKLNDMCQTMVPHHFKNSYDSVINVWTILDFLRSITIKPEDRVYFIKQMLNDVLAMLTTITTLTSTCSYCTDYSSYYDDINYLESLSKNVIDAFNAVFSPVQDNEEHIIYTILTTTHTMLNTSKKEYAIKNQFPDCIQTLN